MTVRSVFVPDLGHAVKLGRKPPVAKGPRLQFGNYLVAPQLPAPPPSVDYTARAAASLARPYKNAGAGAVGDCVIAAGFHVAGVLTGNAGREVQYTDDQAIQQYSAIGGYVPGNEATDQGCVVTDALNFWVQKGLPDGNKILGWLAVNPQKPQEYRSALDLFENLYFGSGLPDVWLQNVRPGFVWDSAPPDPNNGHAFAGFGYDTRGVTVSTWGVLGTITDAAIARCIDELYVLFDDSMLADAEAKAPSGLNWSQLVDDWNSLGGHVTPPGPPPNPPPPAPAAGTVSLLAALPKGPTKLYAGGLFGGRQLATVHAPNGPLPKGAYYLAPMTAAPDELP